MEVNIVEMGLNMLKYLHSGAPPLRRKIVSDEIKFIHFQQEFNRLVGEEGLQSLSQDLESIYEKFSARGHVLMDAKNRQLVLNQEINQGFEEMDNLMDQNFKTIVRADRLISTL